MEKKSLELGVVALLATLLFAVVPAQGQECDLDPPNPPLPEELIGVLPIPVLGAGFYKGQMGGLYPDGENEPPVSHRPIIRSFRDLIVPRATHGGECALDPECEHGLIGMLSIGFSNPTHEFGAFVHQENANLGRNADVVMVSGSQGGQDVVRITCSDPEVCTLDDNMSNLYWDGVLAKVERAGLTPEQVQVAWVKATVQGPTGTFAQAAGALRRDLETLFKLLKIHYPNVQIAYVSSRIYGGYKDGGSPEPYAYEEGFAYKRLIADQIDGSDPGLDTSVVPLILWGPYIWANANLEPYEGLFWCPEDFEVDGDNQHPNEHGEQKVADSLSGFFATDSSTRTWWNRALGAATALATFTPTDDAYVLDDGTVVCGTGFGADSRLLVTHTPSEEQRAFVRFDISSETRPVLRAFLGFRGDPAEPGTEAAGRKGGPANVFRVDVLEEDWSEATVDWCSQPAVAEQLAGIPDKYSRSSHITLDVTEAVANDGDSDGVVSFRIDADLSPVVRGYMSKETEAGQTFLFPPQLTLIVDDTGP